MTTALAITHSAFPVISEPAFAITQTGLRVNRQASWDEWTDFMLMLAKEYSRIKWLISDALAYGNDAFGDDIYQLVDEMWSEQTIANYTSTARRIPLLERRADVSFTNHAEVASLTTEDRKHALSMVASKQWGREDLREYKRNLKGLPQAGTEQTITLRATDIVYKADKIIVVFDKPMDEIVEFKAIVRKRIPAVVQTVSDDSLEAAA
jgi:hypothetical protein